MGIKVEFNPDLALRKFGASGRNIEECLPERLVAGETYPFLKEGQRNYWLEGEIPLVETCGNQQLTRPLASIVILEYTHFVSKKGLYTKGIYKIVEVYDINDPRIYFEGFNKTK
jgi:hypothetical protein